MPSYNDMPWERLQANVHTPEGQEAIRREIRKGSIRVVPAGDGGIRIIPLQAVCSASRETRALVSSIPREDVGSGEGASHNERPSPANNVPQERAQGGGPLKGHMQRQSLVGSRR